MTPHDPKLPGTLPLKISLKCRRAIPFNRVLCCQAGHHELKQLSHTLVS